MRWIALMIVVVVAVPCRGADTGIEGSRLVIRERGTTRKLAFVSKDPALPFPALGSADDPAAGTPGGVTIDLVTPAGVGTLVVPGGAGTPGWKAHDATLDSYAWKNPLAPAGPSPVRSLGLRERRVLKIVARDVPLALASPLGSVGIRITTGSIRSCALFDAPTVVKDVPGSFAARGAVAPPADCSNASLGGAPVCGDGALDTGEECDGLAFGTSVACTYEPGLAQPACQPDCRCCALLACSAFNFEVPCCPGFVCPRRIGPNEITFCRPACQTDTDCSAGGFCLGGICRTPTCSSNDQCPGGICLGVCCYDLPGFGFVCP